MTDPTTPIYGLGAIPSLADPNDWPIDLLYASLPGAPIDAGATTSFIVPGKLPPVIDQGSTPQCVAFSQSTLKAYEDLKDQGPFNFDEGLFFRRIGGNASGAVTRTGLNQLLKVGYPVVGTDDAAHHRIAAYYSVPVTEAAIKNALVNFGIVTVVLPWYEEWFRPVNGILPPPRILAGYHEIDVIGWDSRGARLRQSWGTDYGLAGDVFMSWAVLVAKVEEAWKTVDQIVAPSPTATYHVHISARAVVQIATLRGSCISGWARRGWGVKASSAPCRSPEVRKGCASGQATVAYVTAGVFAGQRIRVAAGVTVVRS